MALGVELPAKECFVCAPAGVALGQFVDGDGLAALGVEIAGIVQAENMINRMHEDTSGAIELGRRPLSKDTEVINKDVGVGKREGVCVVQVRWLAESRRSRCGGSAKGVGGCRGGVPRP